MSMEKEPADPQYPANRAEQASQAERDRRVDSSFGAEHTAEGNNTAEGGAPDSAGEHDSSSANERSFSFRDTDHSRQIGSGTASAATSSAWERRHRVLSGVQEALADLWRTRPVRIPASQGGDAYLAGACYGIAVRYRISTTAVRVAFAASTMWNGAGLIVYLVCWGLMPRYSMRYSPWEAMVGAGKTFRDSRYTRERNTGILLGLATVVLAISEVKSLLSAQFSLTYLAILLLFAFLLWFLHKQQPIPPVGLLVDAPSDRSTAPSTSPGESEAPLVDLRGFTPVPGFDNPFFQALGSAANQGGQTWHTLTKDSPAQPAWNAETSGVGGGFDSPVISESPWYTGGSGDFASSAKPRRPRFFKWCARWAIRVYVAIFLIAAVVIVFHH